jgi:hypothetical protein
MTFLEANACDGNVASRLDAGGNPKTAQLFLVDSARRVLGGPGGAAGGGRVLRGYLALGINCSRAMQRTHTRRVRNSTAICWNP